MDNRKEKKIFHTTIITLCQSPEICTGKIVLQFFDCGANDVPYSHEQKHILVSDMSWLEAPASWPSLLA